ncbi:uncharacterized protein [Dysidea avara]|uniref:uncharacterized protein isoform X2 n=1 Tax=Dysidea avara TaxID=196820 RepID=UPI003330925E
MAASDNERSKRPHLKDLYDHVVVKAARKWKKIGAQLLVNDCTCTAVLNNIEDNCHQQVEKCCEYMLQKWLETNVSASWDELIQALTSPSVQLNHLASEITKMLEMKTHLKMHELDSVENQIEIQSSSRSPSDDRQCEVTTNTTFKILILICLFLIMLLQVYIVMILKIEVISTTTQSKCNCTEVNNNTELNLPQIIQEEKQDDVTSPIVDSWITQLDNTNNNTAPVILKMSNFAEKVNNSQIWYSDPFFAFERGYQMVLGLDATGSHDGRGTHMSVYLFLTKGQYDDELEQSGHWPMAGLFSIELLNQHNDSHHHTNVFWFMTKRCSKCTSRVVNGTIATGYGHDRFISLGALNSNTFYHENDNVYFRVSFTACYSCDLLKKRIDAILGLVLLWALDYCAIFVLMMCVEVYRSLKETSKLVFGFQFNYAVVQDAAFKDTLRIYIPLAMIGVVEILPILLYELTDFIEFDITNLVVNSIKRFTYIFTFYGSVSAYTYVNKHYVVVKPLLLLASFQIVPFNSAIIFTLFVVIFDMFLINIQYFL